MFYVFPMNTKCILEKKRMAFPSFCLTVAAVQIGTHTLGYPASEWPVSSLDQKKTDEGRETSDGSSEIKPHTGF